MTARLAPITGCIKKREEMLSFRCGWETPKGENLRTRSGLKTQSTCKAPATRDLRKRVHPCRKHTDLGYSLSREITPFTLKLVSITSCKVSNSTQRHYYFYVSFCLNVYRWGRVTLARPLYCYTMRSNFMVFTLKHGYLHYAKFQVTPKDFLFILLFIWMFIGVEQ